jgi:N utilization substance protein B
MSVEASNTTKTIFSQKILSRRAARIMCVQCLYALLVRKDTNTQVDNTLMDIINLHAQQEEGLLHDKIEHSHLIKIVRFAIEHKEIIDAQISPNLAADWSVARLPLLVYSILATAIAEMAIFPQLERKIIINDYLEIAKIFNHEGEVGFINKVIDNAAKSSILST